MIDHKKIISLLDGFEQLKAEALAGNMGQEDLDKIKHLIEVYTDWNVAYYIIDIWLKKYAVKGTERNAKEAKDASQEF